MSAPLIEPAVPPASEPADSPANESTSLQPVTEFYGGFGIDTKVSLAGGGVCLVADLVNGTMLIDQYGQDVACTVSEVFSKPAVRVEHDPFGRTQTTSRKEKVVMHLANDHKMLMMVGAVAPYVAKGVDYDTRLYWYTWCPSNSKADPAVYDLAVAERSRSNQFNIDDNEVRGLQAETDRHVPAAIRTAIAAADEPHTARAAALEAGYLSEDLVVPLRRSARLTGRGRFDQDLRRSVLVGMSDAPIEDGSDIDMAWNTSTPPPPHVAPGAQDSDGQDSAPSSPSQAQAQRRVRRRIASAITDGEEVDELERDNDDIVMGRSNVTQSTQQDVAQQEQSSSPSQRLTSEYVPSSSSQAVAAEDPLGHLTQIERTLLVGIRNDLRTGVDDCGIFRKKSKETRSAATAEKFLMMLRSEERAALVDPLKVWENDTVLIKVSKIAEARHREDAFKYLRFFIAPDFLPRNSQNKEWTRMLLHPWFLGAWCGDGNERDSAIYTTDPEVVHWCREYAYVLNKYCRPDGADPVNLYKKISSERHSEYHVEDRFGRRLKNCYLVQFHGSWNPVKEGLRQLGVLYDKSHTIGTDYTEGSNTAKLGYVAGLIDSDGCNAGVHGYVVTQNTPHHEQIMLDLVKCIKNLNLVGKKLYASFMRSTEMGFLAGTSIQYVVSITGDLDVLVPHIRIPRKQDPYLTGMPMDTQNKRGIRVFSEDNVVRMRSISVPGHTFQRFDGCVLSDSRPDQETNEAVALAASSPSSGTPSTSSTGSEMIADDSSNLPSQSIADSNDYQSSSPLAPAEFADAADDEEDLYVDMADMGL